MAVASLTLIVKFPLAIASCVHAADVADAVPLDVLDALEKGTEVIVPVGPEDDVGCVENIVGVLVDRCG